ncbi:MAG TPA: pyridoxal phosphate-dependent aminotransferase [Afifellaceae bacterium]|nr:pyridoxal phosphate-dependent aminotransferase [Afifellaceae bacterium]
MTDTAGPGHFDVSSRVDDLVISGIKEMAMRAARLPDVASLAWGLPSFRTPGCIRERIKSELDHDPDIGKYALPDGLPALREAVTDEHRAATGISVDPDRNVIITAGNMQATNALLHTALDPGDEVIVTDPGFSSHIQQIRLCSGKPVCWPLDEDAGWALDVDRLAGLITGRTRAIILVSPSNPTGSIFSEPDLRAVGRIVKERGLLLIIDDPYHHFTYENRPRYFNPASVPDLFGNVAYCFTFSKCFAMSGWRLGYMIVPEHLKRQVLKVHDATLICAPRISQVAGHAALTGDRGFIDEFAATLDARRSLICERLDRLPHLFSYSRPEGAYYVFPRIVADHDSSRAFAIDLLERVGVSVTPGSAFGPTGEHHVRMAFCGPEDDIDRAFDRMEKHFPG